MVSNVSKSKRMSITLNQDAATLLSILAKNQNISQNEALRRAIATESYIQQQIANGGTILLQKDNGDIREVVFR